MSLKNYRGQGHWFSRKKLQPNTHFGFVYCITNTVTGRMYIGKKQYYSYMKGRKHREMDWRSYTGSSKELNTDIKKHGKKKFKFEVLKEYSTRGWLTYGEANWQHKLDTLTARLPGTDVRAYYNKSILGVRFVPGKKYHPEECKEI